MRPWLLLTWSRSENLANGITRSGAFCLLPTPNYCLTDPKQKQQEVKDTIDNIDLNCDYWVKNRQNYYCEYLKMESEEEGRKYLQKNAPILLAELLRPSQKTTVVEDV